jgi:hypothetical protein
LTPGPRPTAPARRPPQHAGKSALLPTPPRARARRCQPATRTRPAAITPPARAVTSITGPTAACPAP